MNFLKDENAQTGLILFVIIGLFIMGLVYVMIGAVMNENQVANNQLMSNTNLPYTQKRADMMSNIYDGFAYWPLYMLLLFVIYGIKKAIDKQSGQV